VLAAVPLLGLALLGLAALFWRQPRLRGTTLVAPWFWSLTSLVSLVGAELAIALWSEPASTWIGPLRLAAATSTFCPTMALLGAKRPQDRGWQAIVLSLWGILSLPSIEWLLFGGQTELHPARFWFLVILIAVGASNGLGTRYWPSSLLFSGGQILLLTSLFSAAPRPWMPPVSIAAIVLAWWFEAAQWPRSAHVAQPLDRVWLDFRDAFGVVWALRIIERMNASSRMYAWPVTLTWQGFATVSGSEIHELPPLVEESLRTLLRRFVSPEWIAARLEAAPASNVALPVA
jgi:hypothetical protein